MECTTIPILDDEVKEENESLIFVISSSDAAVRLDTSSTDVFIVDDDGMHIFKFLTKHILNG